MATRRVAKSAVDWAKFQSLVPNKYQDAFRQLKVKSDGFTGRVQSKPEALSSIDFAKYKAAGVNAAMVDNFEKAYKAIEVPYPTDKDDVKGQIDILEKQEMTRSKVELDALKELQTVAVDYLKEADLIPPIKNHTWEMFYDYFPEQYPDMQNPPIVTPAVIPPEERGIELQIGERHRTLEEEIEYISSGQRWKDAKDYHNLRGQWADDYKLANPAEFPEWHAEREKKLAAEAKQLAESREK